MSDKNEVQTAEAAKDLPDATWVFDSTDNPYCLIDTHMGFPQRMAMRKGGRSLTALENLTYPLHLAEFTGDCEHKWGHHELGHCHRCGQVSAEPRPLFIDFHTEGHEE
jgi:hypothetical protein